LKERSRLSFKTIPLIKGKEIKETELIHHPYRLLVVDIDGTLQGKDRNISTEDREALDEVRNLGIQVALSTGRVTRACLDILNKLSLDGYHIFFDGALVVSPTRGDEVYVEPLNPAVLKEAIEFAHLEGVPLELYSATHYFAERENWSTQAHRQFFGLEPTLVDFNELWKQERIIKGGLVAISREEADKVRSFCERFDGTLRFSWARTPAYPGVGFINVLAPGVSKGRALEALASYLGIPLAEVMAIGDGINDIPLLSVAGMAIVMGNATDEVKSVADYVTLDVDHSGVAAAIKEFLL
jgi:Cof subfamily protein (haloacid dehalogenase superfamily)